MWETSYLYPYLVVPERFFVRVRILQLKKNYAT